MVINTNGKVRVFVYGSLKRGQPNNVVMRSCKGAVCLGIDYIEGRFSMHDFGPFPALVWDGDNDDPKVNTIYGEVWAGNEDMLAATDMLEGQPHFYKRAKLWTKGGRDRVWAYFLNSEWVDEAEAEVPGGIWKPTATELKQWKLQGVNHVV
jgi:gamma-glutamylcyclotransferase (GGCT)/AIG2-like uncharacterized protein YtfP